MFDPGKLFKERLQSHLKGLNRYLRYIFNGHFMIALMFIIIALAVYYQKWLANVSMDFPAAVVMAFILGLLVSYNPIQSFLKEPDKVYLIVQERAMRRYFNYALIYNFIVQLYIVVATIAVITPLYSTFYAEQTNSQYLTLIALVLVLKCLNLLFNFQLLKVQDPKIRNLSKLLRLVVVIWLFYTLLTEKNVIIALIFLIIIYIQEYFFVKKWRTLNWDALIDNDRQGLAKFYRFVSMFADVPFIQKKISQRKIIARLFNGWTKFSPKTTFDYLFKLTFIRSGDYFNLFIRLTIIGSVLIYFLPNEWMKIAFAILFLYMTSFQLISLFYHHRTSIWLEIYPLNMLDKISSFIKLSGQLAFLQTIIFTLIFLSQFDFKNALIILGLGSLFNYLFHHFYIKKRISKI